MGAETDVPGYTFDDFCLLVKDGQKADLIDGAIHMASPDNTDANELFVWLAGLMDDFVRRKRLGKVYGSRVAFRITERNSPEPDIAFVRADRLHLVRRGFVEGPPDLAVEIVSPDSIDRDYRRKREQYRRAGVSEYWIVDEMERVVTLLRLGPTKRYRVVRPRKGVLHSETLADFWFRPEWFWQEPLPDKIDLLKELLARPRTRRSLNPSTSAPRREKKNHPRRTRRNTKEGKRQSPEGQSSGKFSLSCLPSCSFVSFVDNE